MIKYAAFIDCYCYPHISEFTVTHQTANYITISKSTNLSSIGGVSINIDCRNRIVFELFDTQGEAVVYLIDHLRSLIDKTELRYQIRQPMIVDSISKLRELI